MLGNLLGKISAARDYASAKNNAGKIGGIQAVLDFLDKQQLYPEFYSISEGVNDPECTIGGKRYLIFASNNYLSLTNNPEVKNAAKRAIDKYGVGPGGSRVISGNVVIIEELERKIADLVGAEDCLTFPTGYMANIAVFQALMDPLFMGLPAKPEESVIFSDENNHGSIVDGVRLSRAKRVIFKHDDLEDLKNKIRENDLPNKLIVTEGVFSLEGEILELDKYVALAKETDSKLMIDDAHGVGILGKSGGGTPELYNCGQAVDIIMGCMDKAFGGTGGFLAGSKQMIRYLRIAARSSILSSAIPTGMAGAMVESVDQIIAAEETRKELFEMAKYLKTQLKDRGFTILGRDDLPSVPLLVGKENMGVEFAKQLMGRGIYSPVVRWPAVPEGTSRFRLLVMASHSTDHIDRLINACTEVGRELRLI